MRHVGSAHDEVELGILYETAQELLAGVAQGALELGTMIPRRTTPLTRAPGPRTLVPDPLAPRRQREEVVPPGHVVRTQCRLLDDVLAAVYDGLGFSDAVGDECFRDLVTARVVEPTSLSDVDRVLADLGRVSASHPPRSPVVGR